jgi:CTP-dependent riboflavin kinase
LDVQVKSDGGLIEFLASLQSQQENDGNAEYVTTRQICDQLGISEKRACKLIKELIDKGLVEHGYVPSKSIDGRNVRSNGYRLKPS